MKFEQIIYSSSSVSSLQVDIIKCSFFIQYSFAVRCIELCNLYNAKMIYKQVYTKWKMEYFLSSLFFFCFVFFFSNVVRKITHKN
mmetsp:Transcript_9939/g.11077  ORF Transcript_9939/g.11077 Transcript_9939/m.11077 type:complete len:85 (-) Transcript_9939:33-287(-)